MSNDQNREANHNSRENQIAEKWIAAVERTKLNPNSAQKAKFLGCNIRVKIPEIFIAALDTVKASGSIFAVVAAPATWPLTIPVAVWECYCAAHSLFPALVERLGALQYVTTVILAAHEQIGVEEDALRQEVENFLNEPNTRKFSWHLGMSEEKIDDARNDLYDGWISRTVNELNANGFLKIEEGKIFPQSKNVEWQIGL